MPFLDDAQPAGLAPAGIDEVDAASDPSFGSLLGAAFQRENTVGSAITAISEGYDNPSTPYDSSFDPWSDVKGYEDYLGSFIDANSFEDVARVKSRIDNERSRAEMLQSGGAMGTVAELIAGIADPINLIPVGGQMIRVGRLGERAVAGALSVGAVAGGSGLATEGVLQATQETRTAQESALNVAGSVLLGGVLGGGVGAVFGKSPDALDTLAKGFLDQSEGMADDIASNIPNSGGPISGGSTVGAKSALPTLEEETIAGLGKLPKWIRKTSPTLRLQTSPEVVSRIQGQELAENPLMTKGNLEGKASPVAIESLMRQWNYPLYTALVGVDDIFVKYRTGNAAKMGDLARIRAGDVLSTPNALTHDDFLKAVGRAMWEDDASDIIEVAEAAKLMRKTVFDPMKDRAIERGILDADVDSKVAASYMMRMYNHDKIVSDGNGFRKIITDWYESEQAMKAEIQGRVQTISDDMSRTRAKIDGGKIGDPARIAELENEYVRLRDTLEEQVLSWQGKSSAAAKGAVKRRADYDTKRKDAALAKGEEGEFGRLSQADRAVMAAAKRIMAANTRLERGDLDNIAAQTVSRILGTPAGRLPYDVEISAPGFMRALDDDTPDLKAKPLKGIQLMIPTKLIVDYLETDISVLAKAYTRTMAPDLEMAGRGWLDLDSKLKQIDDAYSNKKAKATTPEEQTKLHDHMGEDIEMIKAIWERLRGTYALPKNPDGLLSRSFAVARDLNYLRLLGQQTFSSIPDIGHVVVQHGMRNFTNGIVPMIKDWKTYRLAAEDVKTSGEGIDMIINSYAMNLGEVFDDFGRHSKFERGLKKATNAFGYLTLITPWNTALKQFVGIVGQTRSLQAIENLINGTIDNAERARLALFGINDDDARAIYGQFSKHGVKHSNIWWANTNDWTDVNAARVYRAAMSKEINKVIVTPGQEKPLLLSTELGRTVMQFRSFSMSSMQRVTMAAIQQRDAKAVAGVTMMVGLGMLAYYLKTPNEKLSNDPAVWVAEGIDRSGVTGWLFDANNMIEKGTRGSIGVSRLVGAPPMSRYASRNLVESFLGPTSGLATDAATIIGSVTSGDIKESDMRAARRMFPLQNAIGFRRGFDALEEGANNALGVPMKAK